MKKLLLTLLLASVSSLLAADGAAVYKAKCFSCHGDNAAKSALNKSQIIAGWDVAKIIASMNGYKNGEGGVMKNIMKPIATGLNEEDTKAVAATIASFK